MHAKRLGNGARDVRHHGRRVWVLVALSAVGGCDSGDRRYDLAGSVTFRGKPVATGTIFFEPAAEQGNNGPPGFAKIKDGTYDTRQPDGQGTIGGPHVVRIVGLDGVANGELLNGLPLFPEFVVATQIPRENAIKDFDVPSGKPTKP